MDAFVTLSSSVRGFFRQQLSGDLAVWVSLCAVHRLVL